MNILDTALQPRYTVAELNEAVQHAVLAERQACAAAVCPRCATGEVPEYVKVVREDWLHLTTDPNGRRLSYACPAAPIHARGQAQAEKDQK